MVAVLLDIKAMAFVEDCTTPTFEDPTPKLNHRYRTSQRGVIATGAAELSWYAPICLHDTYKHSFVVEAPRSI